MVVYASTLQASRRRWGVDPLAAGASVVTRQELIHIPVEGGLVFSKDGDMIWECSNCGHIVIGKNAPKICPVCQHPQAYFKLRAENY